MCVYIYIHKYNYIYIYIYIYIERDYKYETAIPQNPENGQHMATGGEWNGLEGSPQLAPKLAPKLPKPLGLASGSPGHQGKRKDTTWC